MRQAVAGAGTDEVAGRSDAELTDAVRQGDATAYAVLYERHLLAARRAAGSLTATPAEREDLVAEAFVRLLRVLRAGGGPSEEFRPYLITTMRNVLISWRRRDAAVSVVADVPEVAPTTGPETVVAGRMHAALAADAFACLPERWRLVLWRTEIEGEAPAKVARSLGMTPNGVAALAYRAREGLRQAYLDQHLPSEVPRGCRGMVTELAGWVRDRYAPQKMRRIGDHVQACPECQEIAEGLRRLNQELSS
ncbi:RNA polymerase sigma factor [Actinophytocola oryzae]|uniref:RNA polymerase sigma factor (Sigma-70 family) n=1 Tax=Actinophytocola oryzae TaxID=502181 RepID=A0A4R7V486_9PSEU|nr:sigma-70 family RNA polymerase sigma factor [Actinophytocola oryzae]TDV43554.1 RNA polymerase sigma factor (sigma-70 family) [Actinophytocola oryzae]